MATDFSGDVRKPRCLSAQGFRLTLVIHAAAMCQSRDYKVVNGATIPSYDAAAMGISMKWKQLVGRVKLAMMAAGGAVVIGMSQGVPPILVIVLAAGVGIGFLWLFLYK